MGAFPIRKETFVQSMGADAATDPRSQSEKNRASLFDSVTWAGYNTVMKSDGTLWTLGELTDAVEAALADGYDGAASGRVRDVPDRRTIRYYTTLGLIDRPAAMRGRTAFYGHRHLLQIVAIKKLQAQGKSLAEIQRALAGQTDTELGRIGGLDAAGPAALAGGTTPAQPPGDFWKRGPAAHSASVAETEQVDASPAPVIRQAAADIPRTYFGVPLRDGVTLLLVPSRPLDDDDVEAIRSAAAPLIRTLTRSHLIDPREGGEDP